MISLSLVFSLTTYSQCLKGCPLLLLNKGLLNGCFRRPAGTFSVAVVRERPRPWMSARDLHCLTPMLGDRGLVAWGQWGRGRGSDRTWSREQQEHHWRLADPTGPSSVIEYFRSTGEIVNSIPCILSMLSTTEPQFPNFPGKLLSLSLSHQRVRERGLASKSALAFKFKPKRSNVAVLQADPCRITANASPGDGF